MKRIFLLFMLLCSFCFAQTSTQEQVSQNPSISQSPNVPSVNGGNANNNGYIHSSNNNTGISVNANKDSTLANSGTQRIATAFTFGLAGFAFATLPFLFVLISGIYKANNSNQAHSSSIVSVFTLAFVVHFLSCVFFMTGIKLLDVLSAIYEPNYIQDKIFSIFWARGENAVFTLAGANGSIEDKGAYLQLFIVQTIIDWIFLLMYFVVFLTASAYGMLEAKKDVMQSNTMHIFIWVLVANIVGFFAFVLWAKIATLALFMPHGDILTQIVETYRILFGIDIKGN